MRDAAPGARFWMNTSARSSSCAMIVFASACLMSSVRLSFERLTQTKCEAMPCTRSS